MADEDARMHKEWREAHGPNIDVASGWGLGVQGAAQTRDRIAVGPGRCEVAFVTRCSHGGRRGHAPVGGRGSRGSHGCSEMGTSAPGSGSSGSGVQAPARGQASHPPPSTATASRGSVPAGSDACRGTKRPGESQGTESGSTASGSKPKHRKKVPKEDQRSPEARQQCRRLFLDWFEKHDMPYLERTFLNDGPKGLTHATNVLRDLLLDGLAGDEFEEDRRKFGWDVWIDEQVQEALFNSMMPFNAVYGDRSDPTDAQSDLRNKLMDWKAGVNVVKGRGRTTLPSFIEKDLANDIATRGRGGVLWLPLDARVVQVETLEFEGTFGVVRRVRITGVSFIPEWLEFAGKSMKVRDPRKNREERSIEALACPVDHPGVIKINYLNVTTLEAYSLWWNGGSVRSMRIFDAKIGEDHSVQILKDAGPDYEARKKLVVYRKNRAFLAWALLCIVDVVHKYDVLHNDITPNNVMLHFPEDREGTVFIGLCDWGMATFRGETSPSNYGVDCPYKIADHKARYECAAPELFHAHGGDKARGTSTSPMRMAHSHSHTAKSESFSVGTLAKNIYKRDSTSLLFQQNRDPDSVKMRFEHALNELTRRDPAARMTITDVVNTLKSRPYNLRTPTMCFRNS